MAAFFALDVLPTFHITLESDAFQKLKDEPRKFVHGEFSHDGVTYKDIGVRLKGHRSMRAIDNKPSFKLRFDKYVEGTQFLGQTQLTLNNLVEDPTMVREILGYNLLRELGVPAPKIGYAEVYVNQELYGLYAIIENMDETFLARSFSDNSGGLYEGEYGCDMFEEDVEGFERDSGKDDKRTDLHGLAQAAAAPPEQIFDRLFDREKGLLHTDAFLTYLAVSAFVGDFDGYRHSHNYRVYRNPAENKWYFIPWGLDRTFKQHLPLFDSEGLLAKRCFADARCRLEYVRTLKKVADRFEAMQLEQGLHVVSAFIDGTARKDTRKPYDDAEIQKARTQLLEFIKERPDKVRRQLTCIDPNGNELDQDGDGFGCLDCNDADPGVHPGAADVCDGTDNDCSTLVDDNPTCACPTVAIEGTTFHLCNLPLPWNEALAFCQAKGLTLARMDRAEQAKALRDAASKHNKERWWIGLSDHSEEGTFRWTDGSPVEWTNWAKREPDNDGCNQDCAALKERGKGKWHDTHCGQHRPFICR